MNTTKANWGKTADGTSVHLYTLTNDHGAEVQITNYGGIVVSIKVPDNEGRLEDVVLGFDSLQGYLTDTYKQENPYFGAVIGRYGNRIAKGSFKLEGREYTLAQNNGNNHLHGGKVGFDKVVWEAQELSKAEGPGLRLQYISQDMEEGYPGALTVSVIYTLTNSNELKIDYQATTDKTTVLNLTNHTYFNLTGSAKRDIIDHRLRINAGSFVPIDAESIPTGELQDVANTPFDFKDFTAIGERINADHEQLSNGIGYDHTWVLGNNGEMKLAASAEETVSGRQLQVYTTEPGVQFYTGNYLNGKLVGKGGVAYKKRWGFCLETQHFPDSPNQPQFPSVVLKPGETYQSTTVYKFSVKSS